MELLSDTEIDTRIAQIDAAWRREGDSLVRDFELADFDAAIALVNDVAALAQRADHHPDILVHDYKHVRLTLSTHVAGGLTGLDFALAAAIDPSA